MKRPLKETLLANTNCALCSLAVNGACNLKKMVLPQGGNGKIQIALVGEAPVSMDVAFKVPFKGPTGKLIAKIIETIGADPEIFYYTNALLCSYPQGEKPGVAELNACRNRLIRELQDLPDLKVVILLGGLPLQSLLKKNGVTKEIYNVYWSDEIEAFVIPCYHPAFVFRNNEAFPDVIWAFKRAIGLLNAPKNILNPPPVESRIARNPKEAVDLLNEIANIQKPTWISLDTETDGLDPISLATICMGFSWEYGKAVIIPWILDNNVLDNNQIGDFYVTPEMLDAIKRVEANPNLKFIYHNGDFDVRVLYFCADVFLPIAFDTMISDYILDERGGQDEMEGNRNNTRVGSHRLKSSAKRYLNVPDWEADIKKYLKNSKVFYSNIPRHKLHEYLSYDVCYTLMLKDSHIAMLNMEESSREGYPSPLECINSLMIPAQNEIIRMEIEGVFINRAIASEHRTEMDTRIAVLKDTIERQAYELGWDLTTPINTNSPKQLAHLIYDVMNIPLTKDLRTTLGGKQVKVDRPATKDVLVKLKNKHAIFGNIEILRNLIKRRSTYVHSIIENSKIDGRAHTKFALTVAKTGRLSSRGPNLQNIEPGSKIYFEPDIDSQFVNCDYKQLEIRVAAYYSRDPKLIEACKGDVHTVVSREIFYKIYAQIDAATTCDDLRKICSEHRILHAEVTRDIATPYLDSEFEKFKKIVIKAVRNAAKPILFGLIYGREAFSLANGPLQCSVSDAQMYINTTFDKFPLLKQWLDKQQHYVLETGWIETASGRRRRFHFMDNQFENRILKQAVNAPVQGFASDICLLSFVKTAAIIRDNNLGRPLLLVHDAISWSLYNDTLPTALAIIKEGMEQTVTDPEIVFEIDTTVGLNYKEQKEWDWNA